MGSLSPRVLPSNACRLRQLAHPRRPGFFFHPFFAAPTRLLPHGGEDEWGWCRPTLAYSSVEHMGILSLGVGLGGLAAAGAMFHAVNHSLTKAALFLVAGNILAAYRTKSVGEVRGV